jgi:hypothetical protein
MPGVRIDSSLSGRGRAESHRVFVGTDGSRGGTRRDAAGTVVSWDYGRKSQGWTACLELTATLGRLEP